MAVKKKARGKYKRTDKQKKIISSSNMSREGSRVGIFGSQVYGKLVIELIESDTTELDNNSIKHLVNLNTWAQRGKKEFKDAKLIAYKSKKGGRGSKFITKDIKNSIINEFKKYYSKQVLLKIYDKVQRLIRVYSKTTIEKESIFTPKGKRKVRESKQLGVFGYVLETIAEGNEYARIENDLTELEHKYTKIFLGSIKCSETEEELISYHIKRLKKLKKEFEGVSVKIDKIDIVKKAGEMEKKFGIVLKEIESHIEKKQNAPNDKIIRELFKNALSFIRVRYEGYSIYDIFEEMLFQLALKFRLDEGSDKYYLTAWLYQSLVLSDFTG